MEMILNLIAISTTVALIASFHGVHGLDNGLALTPPMGWLAWERYRCNIDCETYPDECISEKLFMRTADLLVSEGYADLGYKYVIVDDCWMATSRSADGMLEADNKRFPSGIKALSNYVHSKGLKFGLYQNIGTKTCAGYPGVMGSEAKDAKQFAEWEVDYVKLDGCFISFSDMDKGYVEFGKHLNNTGRPMVYSCSWPAYQEYDEIRKQTDSVKHIDYASIAEHCNLWRNYDDIQDSWNSVMQISDYFAKKQELWAQYAGPGHWNDPDMLLIGNFGLSFDQSKSQMAIWAVLAAPLFMSNNLSAVRPEFKEILQNKEIIKISQDTIGVQGTRILKDDSIDIWSRPVSPVHNGICSYAIAFVSRRTDGAPHPYKITVEHLGLLNPNGYTIKNLFDGKCTKNINNQYYVSLNSTVHVRVNPSDEYNKF